MFTLNFSYMFLNMQQIDVYRNVQKFTV